MKNNILLLLTNHWADWEAAYAIAVCNAFTEKYHVTVIAADSAEKPSMGGIRAAVDATLAETTFEDAALLILPGGLSWEAEEHPEIVDFLHKAQTASVPIAAICGATTFLCRNGFLDNIRHTGDSRALFAEQAGYAGHEHYVEAQVVVDGGIITANETAAVEFAYEIFKLLSVDEPEELAQWYDNFSNGTVRQ